MSMPEKTFRRGRDKVIAGVCSGLAEYFGLDVVLVRLAYAILSLCTTGFPSLLIYILCWIIVPIKDSEP